MGSSDAPEPANEALGANPGLNAGSPALKDGERHLAYLLVVALRSASPIYLLIFIVAIGMLVHILRKRNFPRGVLEKVYKAG